MKRLGVLVVIAGLAGCGSDKDPAVAVLKTRVAPLRARLHAAQAVLPAPGKEAPIPCVADPAMVGLRTIDEQVLAAAAGNRETAHVGTSTTSSILELPTDSYLDVLGFTLQVRPDGLMTKRLDAAAKVKQVVVVRTTSSDPGQLSADTYETILKPATWAGWAFVIDVDPPKLRAAVAVTARTSDEISGIVQKGQRRSMFAGNLVGNIGTAVVAALAGCTTVIKDKAEDQ